MSRSRKKHFCLKVGDPTFKVIFNRKLRRKLKNPNFILDNGSRYKKARHFESWLICDWKFIHYSEEDLRIYFLLCGRELSDKDFTKIKYSYRSK